MKHSATASAAPCHSQAAQVYVRGRSSLLLDLGYECLDDTQACLFPSLMSV